MTLTRCPDCGQGHVCHADKDTDVYKNLIKTLREANVKARETVVEIRDQLQANLGEMLDAAGEILDSVKKEMAIRELHVKVPDDGQSGDHCGYDLEGWPCKTIQILENTDG